MVDGSGPQLASATASECDAWGALVNSRERLQQGGGTVDLVTQYTYDRLGRVLSTTDPTNAVTQFEYDRNGNRTRLVDPVNNETVFTYDALNRLRQETNALGQSRTFTYDALGNVLTRTDRNGRTVTYGYDYLNRRTRETWSGSSYAASYTYDLADQLTQAADGAATLAYVYDGLGRATTVTQTRAGAGAPGPVTWAQQFDLADNRTRLAATVAGTADFATQYTYDAMNRMTRVTQAGQTGGNAVAEKRVDFTYQADSQWAAITRYQDLAGSKLVAASAFSYDGAGRLTALSHTQNATALAGYTWTYDTANRVTGIGNTLFPAESATYSYDAAGQLTGADRSGMAADEGYSYDANGNRTNSGYATGLDNRLQSDGVYTYTYDNEGNRIRRTAIADGSFTEYTWDHRNRLTSVTDKTAGGVVTQQTFYTYDIFDRRLSKQVDWDGAGPQPPQTDYYVYDGQHIALSFHDPDGPGPQAATLQHRYLHGPAVDQILADEVLTSTTTPGNVLWPLTDNLGTVRDLVDFNQTTTVSQVVNHLTYDAYGRITAETNAAIDHLFAYTGRDRDKETGLYYYRARYYDPATGRFLSQDPIGFTAGDASLYRYLWNGPTNGSDPAGLQPPGRRDAHLDDLSIRADALLERIQSQQRILSELRRENESRRIRISEALRDVRQMQADLDCVADGLKQQKTQAELFEEDFLTQLGSLSNSLERLKSHLADTSRQIRSLLHAMDFPSPLYVASWSALSSVASVGTSFQAMGQWLLGDGQYRETFDRAYLLQQTLGNHKQGQYVAALIDGFVPYADPFDDCYDARSVEMRVTRLIGAAAREIVLMYTGAKLASWVVGPQWATASLGQRYLLSRIWLPYLVSEAAPGLEAIYTVAGLGSAIVNLGSAFDALREMRNLFREIF